MNCDNVPPKGFNRKVQYTACVHFHTGYSIVEKYRYYTKEKYCDKMNTNNEYYLKFIAILTKIYLFKVNH